LGSHPSTRRYRGPKRSPPRRPRRGWASASARSRSSSAGAYFPPPSSCIQHRGRSPLRRLKPRPSRSASAKSSIAGEDFIAAFNRIRQANRLAVPWIVDFQAAITSAHSIIENPHGYDWMTRHRADHHAQNRFPEARLFPPDPTLALPETQTKPAPFDQIILLWAKQTNAPKKGNQDMETKCGRFAEWLGHDDMARVVFENCRDYRDAMIDEGDLSSGSILNHLKLLKALFTYAFDNEHITTNPMARIKYSAGDRNERDDFTSEERKLILILARKAEPHVYWINWLCSFLGTRTSEVADANTLDIERIDGISVMSIHRKHRSRDQRLKTKVSTRKLALHGALLDEGFLDYWRSLPVGGPLFPNVPLDTYGKRASKVTTECSIWLRNVVKIPIRTNRFIRTDTPRLPICVTPACRMDHPPSKRTSSVTSSAMRARGRMLAMASGGSRH
jgi:hypothetical protein